MNLSDIATRQVESIGPEATIQQAASRMRDAHVGDLVVVEEKGGKIAPVGILTDRDIVLSVVAFGSDPASIKVRDIMTEMVVCGSTGDPLWHVLGKMKEYGVTRLPLLNPMGELRAIVSLNDILGLLANELMELKRIQEIRVVKESERRRKLA